MEFEASIMPVLMDCSRQRLRSLHMNLLRYGTNIDERITSKELTAALQVSWKYYLTMSVCMSVCVAGCIDLDLL